MQFHPIAAALGNFTFTISSKILLLLDKLEKNAGIADTLAKIYTYLLTTLSLFLYFVLVTLNLDL